MNADGDEGSRLIDPQTTAAFWDEQHRDRRKDNLTGSTPEDELTNLRALTLVRPGARVLNIGVGLGDTTSALIAAGCRVSILDISPVALSRFDGQVEDAFLPEDLPRLPERYFDLALSHLVMQHMDDEALLQQMHHVVRSLAPGGIFAFQFGTAWDQGSKSLRFQREISEALPYCRTLGWITETVEAAKGMVVFAELSENFPLYRFAWYVAHVMPAVYLPRLRPPNARIDVDSGVA